jgi:hypothetical protein
VDSCLARRPDSTIACEEPCLFERERTRPRGQVLFLLIDMETLELVVRATREGKSEKRANTDGDPLNQSHTSPSFETSGEGWMPSQPC